jgi:hypothetical protein
MKLSKEYKIKLEQEFDFVIKKMEESETPDLMLYYFSGIHTLLNRILNLEYSEELLFSFFILERTHKDIISALESLKQGNPIPIFHERFGEKLLELTKELKNGFFNSKTRIEILKELVVLTYTCTGNGYFLTEKGIIDIFHENESLGDNE